MGFFDLFKSEHPVLVREAFEDVKTMVSNGTNMFAAAAAHLLDNEILDVDLGALDEGINAREQHLRRTVLEHLSQHPGRELVFSLKLLSIVTEAERIGDLAKSLVEVAEMAHRPRLGPHLTPLREIRDRVLAQFESIQVGFFNEDEAVARSHMKSHARLKQDIRAYLRSLSNQTDLTPNEAMVFAMSARMMSRTSSHLANIMSTIACPFEEIRSAPAWAMETNGQAGVSA